MCSICSRQQEQSWTVYTEERVGGERMSFPWFTTIISCKVFAGSEITASQLGLFFSEKLPQLQAEKYCEGEGHHQDE